jgi:hypothetical protein
MAPGIAIYIFDQSNSSFLLQRKLSLGVRLNAYAKKYKSRTTFSGSPQTTGVNLALFADDTSLYITERNERKMPDTKTLAE